MAFTEWDSYVPFLEALARQRDRWDSARDFASFDAIVRLSCAELVGGESCTVGAFGYDALLAGLRKEFTEDEPLLGQIKLAALARPALQMGLGDEWQGYFVSQQVDGTEVYAENRFAEPSGWAKLEISSLALSLDYNDKIGLMYRGYDWFLKDGKTQVWEDKEDPGSFYDAKGNIYIHGELQAPTVTDLRQQHYDTESERWRRWSDEAGGFEYYHDEDGVWERYSDGDCYRRLHSPTFGWLGYDEESTLWYDTGSEPPQWRPHDQVGQPLPVLVEQAVVAEQAAAEQRADIEAMRDEILDQALEAARDAGLVPDLVSEEDWLDYVDGRVLEGLYS